jgi:endonuclease I
MKKIFTFLLVNLVFATSFAQIPTGYYTGTTGLTGYPLKTKLSQIITAGHQDQGYSGLWIGYQTTDRDYYYENNGKVLDMYSENPTGADPYEYTIATDQCGNYSAEGVCYNREHTVPQSFFNEASPMRNDIHFIPPTDGKVNGMRSNYPYGVVTNPPWTSLNGSKLGPNTTTGYSGVVFEPINAFKGDIARMIFYFVTRYQNQIPSFSSGNMLDGTTTRSLTQWELEVLLSWHDADPVSQREIDRNNASYTFQGNRNPYIDYPNWVHEVWGYVNTTPDTIAPSTPTNLAVNNVTGSSATATWTASTDNIAVAGYNIYLNAVLFGSSGSNTFNMTGLNPNTLYSVTVVAFDAAGNNSPASAAVNFTTLNVVVPPGNSTELYISEYVEGTSNNRAIELTNATPDPIDLSNYSIQKQVNGAGAWEVIFR